MHGVSEIYLDNNATAPMLPEVLAAMTECYAAEYANAASQHEPGRRTRRRIEQAREHVAQLLGADLGRGDRVVFTSGGTESNWLALCGMLAARAPGVLAISAIEHASVQTAADKLAGDGWRLVTLPVNSSGQLRLEGLGDAIADASLLSVMLGNNETGVLQPVSPIARLAAERSVATHTDASQAVGKIDVNFRELGVAAMTVAAHKFHGPLGIGALVLRADVELTPLFGQGFHQGGLRAGTESVALAVGMERALAVWDHERTERATRLRSLRDQFEQGLQRELPWITPIAADSPRLPQTSCIAFPGLDRQPLQMALDLAGVACSAGSACASGSSQPSPVLLAMGLPEAQIRGALRFSLGASTTALEIDEAVLRISSVCKRLRRLSPG